MARKFPLDLTWSEPAPFPSVAVRRLNPAEVVEARVNPSHVPKNSPFRDLAGHYGLYVIFLNDHWMQYEDGSNVIVYIGMSGVGDGGIGRRLHDHATRRSSLALHDLLVAAEADGGTMSFIWAPVQGASPAREVAIACAEDAMLAQFDDSYGSFPAANQYAGSCVLAPHYELTHDPQDPIEWAHVD